jgi:outer membrane receptor protein involved in Fe transport
MMMRRSLTATLMTSSMLAALPMIAPALAHGQTRQPVSTGQDDNGIEVIVTATKRATKLQDTPISIEVLSTKKLDDLNVASFNDYVALLPSVSFQNTPYQGSNVYFRGVASGGDGNHSGPQPSVGIYLDEEPVTTIGGPLDVHIYDMARIESLAGPQGTLYGASSEAGTIRLITNKPDTGGYYGRIDLDGNTVDHGGMGGKLEGMINIPFSDKVALRVVGWEQHNAGFIDNIAGTRSFLPAGSGITVDNAPYVKNNYNTSEIEGGRAALKVDLDENWTVTGSVIGQATHSKGSAGYDPNVGDLKVQHFLPEYNHDRFIQAALTVQGKIGNFDLTYAGAAMKRTIDSAAD